MPHTRPRPIDVLNAVAYEYRISLSDLTAKRPSSRTAWCCRVRQQAMLRLHRECGMSMRRIGDLLDRDHTSVSHGIQMASKALPL